MIDRRTNRQAYIKTNRQTYRQIGIQTDRQTDRQRDCKTYCPLTQHASNNPRLGDQLIDR